MAINLPNSFVHILTYASSSRSSSTRPPPKQEVAWQTNFRPNTSMMINLKSKWKKKFIPISWYIYWHDFVLGSNATSIPIIKAPDNSSVFGLVNMIDDPLTLGPDLSSTVGRAQGLYGVTSQKDEFSLMMVMNFVFTKGSKYDGSTITIMGRNAVLSKVREMAVVGGSGLFRFARGFVQARTKSVNNIVAVVKYDIYVMHYCNVST